MGLFSGIGGILGGVFGATQQRRAFNSAINDLRNFQQTTLNPAFGNLQNQANTMVDQGLSVLSDGRSHYQLSPEVQAMRQRLTQSTNDGLSPAARIAFEDMNRLMKEDAVSTGNLRSGAFAFGQAELGRRVIADDLTRQQQLLDLFGRQDLSLNEMDLRTGLGLLQSGGTFAGLGNQVLQLSQANTSNIANATIGRGAVNAAQLTGIGAATGGVLDLGAMAYGGAIGAGGGPGGLAGAIGGVTGMSFLGNKT
ncbi:MAG: hypothetical protein ACRCZI_10985 [Cetobacterium sp.]